MRYWFEHSSEVSLREQVVAQVTLGILTGELAPGERLPSIRELARRFGLHANTVSAGYQQLEGEGWVESRKGSGVYVRTQRPESARPVAAGLDRLITNLFEGARRLGIPAADVVERVRAWAEPATVCRVLVVEPDPELRRIVIAELAEAITLPIEGCGFEECAGLCLDLLAGSLVVTLPSKLDRVLTLAVGSRVQVLKVRSVPVSLAAHLPGPEARAGLLVGVASAWPDFLRFARTMLVAAGFDADALLVRDTREPGWREGLKQTAAVVCDVVTAAKLHGCNAIVSRVLADDVPEEINSLL